MKYFVPPYTKLTIEAQFRELSKILHPDAGGTNESFQEMILEKKTALKLAELHARDVRIKKRAPVKMKRKKPAVILHRKQFNFTFDPAKGKELIKLLTDIKKLLK